MFKDIFASIIEQDFAIAYLKLLGQMKYKQITVTMLVETAGYGRATFYAYFSGLKDLRQKLNACNLEHTESVFIAAMDIKCPDERKVYLKEKLIPHVKMFWPLLCDNNMPDHANDIRVRIYDLFREHFNERFKDTKFDSVIVESFCVSGMFQMMTKHFQIGDDVKKPETIDSIIELIDHMMFCKINDLRLS